MCCMCDGHSDMSPPFYTAVLSTFPRCEGDMGVLVLDRLRMHRVFEKERELLAFPFSPLSSQKHAMRVVKDNLIFD